MTVNQTLLAHLEFTRMFSQGTENIAVEALAFILNSSYSAANTFNDLVSEAAGDHMEECTGFTTQVIGEDRSRPDFVGYDKANQKRVIGEAKFGAPLGPGQARSYLEQLPSSGRSLLLFVGPQTKLSRLWDAVVNDIQPYQPAEIPGRQASADIRSARIAGQEWRLAMISWQVLLKKLLEGTKEAKMTQENIRQLQGLVESVDSAEILPFTAEGMNPQFARRVLDLARLVDNVLDQGQSEGWASSLGARWSRNASSYGPGWNLKIPGSPEGLGAWFGIEFNLWARENREDAPLWLHLYDAPASVITAMERKLELQATDGRNFPVRIKLNALYEDMLADVCSQLRNIARAIGENADPS